MSVPLSEVKRGPGGKFLPGFAPKSPGKPAIERDFRTRAAQVLAAADAYSVLKRMVLGDGEDRRFAIRLLVEYAYGKPSQHVDADVKLGGVVVHLPAREEPKVIEHD